MMKKIIKGVVLTSWMVCCTFILQAQTDSIIEIRHYDYSADIIHSANQLYRIVIAGNNGRIATWKDILVTNTKPATAVALNPSGVNFAIANAKFEIEIWSLEKRNTPLGKIKGHTNTVKVLDYSRDSRYLLSAGLDNKVKIWDMKDLSLFKSLPCLHPVNAACFSPNGYFIACDQGKDIVVFNYTKNTAVQGLNGGHKHPVVKVKFSDDGQYLMSLDEGGVMNIWRITDGEIVRQMTIDEVKDADVHHNNKYLATVDGAGKLQIWNLKKGILMQSFSSKQAGKTVHFSYDYDKESALLTHCDNGYCYLWDVARLEPAFDLLAAEMEKERMNLWNRKRENESSSVYAARVNDSLQIQHTRVMNEVLTELGLKWRPLGKPERSAYDSENKGYTLTFPKVNPFLLKIKEADKAAFEEHFDRCVFRNPVYTLDAKDDFGLAYLEVFDSLKNKVFYLDDLNRRVQPQKRMVSGEIVKKVGEEEVVLKQKLKDYFDKEMARQRISDNVKVNVEAHPQEGIGEDGRKVIDYHVAYSYEVIKTDKKEVGDWAPGRYLLAESNAASASVQVIRETFEKELAKYITPGKNMTIKVTGSADATPILRPIKYSGVYGDFVGEPYYLNGNMDNISISYKTGIGTNSQLAFLRTYGVRHFIEQEIPVLQQTRNTFEHHVFVSEERGNQFRRVSIEIVIHDAFRK